MKSYQYLILVLVFLLQSCAFFSKLSSSKGISEGSLYSDKSVFQLEDKTGTFQVKRDIGFAKEGKSFVVKEKINSNDGESKPLEKLISISKAGKVKGIGLLRPEVSQYTVWFSGKKYFSESRLNKKNRSMIVKLISPEEQWSGEREFKFPDSKGYYCYFSQVVECASYSGFLQKAMNTESGVMNFHIIWEGYPYIQEQYLNMPDEFFSKAQLSYDGKNKLGEYRFSLSFGSQVIFYFVDKKGRMIKRLWIAQGYSLIKQN